MNPIYLLKSKPFKLMILILVAPLLLQAIGCSAEPQVAEESVEVGKEAAAYRTFPALTPTFVSLFDPRHFDPRHFVLLIRPSEIEYSHFQTLGPVGTGIQVDAVVGADENRDIFAADRVEIDPSRYRGVFVAHTPSYNLLNKLHTFVSSGGNAAVLINTCLAEDLQAVFGVACAEMPEGGPRFIKEGPGEAFAPFWEGLNVKGGGYGVQLLPGQSDFSCTPGTHPETGSFCTALLGRVGDGNIIFMVSQWAEIGVPENSHYAYAGSILADYLIQATSWSDEPPINHVVAAKRLLAWLVPE